MDTCSAVENLESSQEDQEVLEIVRQGELQKDLTERCILSQCDSSGIQVILKSLLLSYFSVVTYLY